MTASAKTATKLKSSRKASLAVLGQSLFCLLFFVSVSTAQTEKKATEKTGERAPLVFLECATCDIPFIQSQISFVNFVKEISPAQVHVLISTAATETGEEYTLSFQGRNEFEGDDDLLRYQPKGGTAPEEVKKGLAHTVALGLMRYVGKTPVSSRISINFLDKVKPTSVVDKWNSWVFSLSVNSFLSGEQTYRNGMYFASFSANRVTPEMKIRLSLSAMHEKDRFNYEDQLIYSASDSQNFQGLAVKSLNDHWSAGAYFSVNTSTYSNIKLAFSPAPAVEYDLFPYSESTRRQLRFLYRLSFKSVAYREETVYLKTQENLWQESLSVTLELVQKWGTISASLEGANYLHDFSKNRLDLWGEISLRLFQGFNFNLHGGYSEIHDQLSLPREGASYEDVLLRRKQLATTFDYFFSVGLSYTFGSLKSKVVNPRFGDGGGGVSIRISM
jgi:hypothetical protein